eukprot:Clim_evm4s95 gene=Clim_evmTU4s95
MPRILRVENTANKSKEAKSPVEANKNKQSKKSSDKVDRCQWPGHEGDPVIEYYHDHEWSAPKVDQALIFEQIILHIFQAGLNVRMIYSKRENFAKAFKEYDLKKIAAMDNPRDFDKLMSKSTGIIANRAKILATIENAKVAQRVMREKKCTLAEFLFSRYSVPDLKWYDAARKSDKDASGFETWVPVSKRMSKEMKALGFKFLGPSVCFGIMMSCGLLNLHQRRCFRHDQVNREFEKLKKQLFVANLMEERPLPETEIKAEEKDTAAIAKLKAKVKKQKELQKSKSKSKLSPKAKAKAKAKAKSKAKAKAKSKAKAKAKGKGKAKPKAKPKPKAKVKAKTKPKVKAKTKPKAKAKTKPKAKAKANTKSKSRVTAKARSRKSTSVRKQ